MKKQELFYNYVNRKDRPPRQKGYFWASEVGSIIKGYLLPSDFFKNKKIDKAGQSNIISGQAFEAEFKRILEHNEIPFKHEPRYEIKFDDITITVKPDFEFADKVIETKFPVRLATDEEYLERYQYQLELEHRATNKKVYLGIFTHPFDLHLVEFSPDIARFNKIKEALKDFNDFIDDGININYADHLEEIKRD